MDAQFVSSPTTSNTLFGARTSATSKNYAFMHTDGKVMRSDYNNVYTQTWTSVGVERFVVDKNKETTTLHDVSQSYTNSAFQSDYNMYLCALNNAGETRWYSSIKMYSCQIYDNGTLIRDYIPALRSDGIAGLYDVVNDTFYASNGTSDFLYGESEPTIVATQTSVTGTYKIPFDASYTVQANNVNGYTTPSSVTRVASVKSYTVAQQYTLITEIDLSLFDVYGNPINRSTANCYVVRKAGQYKFPLVYGNAIKNGQVNTAAFTNNGGTYSHNFVDGYGNTIATPYIVVDSSFIAHIHNNDTDNLISDLNIVDRDDCVYIEFSVDSIPTTGGNCIISASTWNKSEQRYDAVWSWHIWLWPHDLSSVEITNSTGVKYNIMPVNLASKYDSDGVHIKNWFYQWGRKDPMLLPSAWNSTTDHSPGSITKTSKATSLYEGLRSPSTFYYNSPTGSMGIQTIWFDSTKYYNLWDAACASVGSSDNDTVKTVYDPCPVGWKVPNGNVFTGMSEISYNDGIYKLTRYSGDTTGVTIHANTCRNYYDGNINAGGECHLLTSAVIYSSGAYQANSLRLNGGYVYSSNGTYMASGESIRPVQDSLT